MNVDKIIKSVEKVADLEQRVEYIEENGAIGDSLDSIEKRVDKIEEGLEVNDGHTQNTMNEVVQARGTFGTLNLRLENIEGDVGREEENWHFTVQPNQWVFNATSNKYEYTLVHNLNSTNLLYSAYTLQGNSLFFISGDIVDNNRMTLKSNTLEGIKVILSAKYLTPVLTGTYDNEIVDARMGKRTLREKVAEINSEIISVENEIHRVDREVTTVKGDVNRIELSQIPSINADINIVKGDVAQNKSDIEGNRQSMTALRNDLDAIITDNLPTIEVNLSEVINSRTDGEGVLRGSLTERLGSDYNYNKSKITALTNAQNGITKEILDARGTFTTLEDRIVNVEDLNNSLVGGTTKCKTVAFLLSNYEGFKGLNIDFKNLSVLRDDGSALLRSDFANIHAYSYIRDGAGLYTKQYQGDISGIANINQTVNIHDDTNSPGVVVYGMIVLQFKNIESISSVSLEARHATNIHPLIPTYIYAWDSYQYTSNIDYNQFMDFYRDRKEIVGINYNSPQYISAQNYLLDFQIESAHSHSIKSEVEEARGEHSSLSERLYKTDQTTEATMNLFGALLNEFADSKAVDQLHEHTLLILIQGAYNLYTRIVDLEAGLQRATEDLNKIYSSGAIFTPKPDGGVGVTMPLPRETVVWEAESYYESADSMYFATSDIDGNMFADYDMAGAGLTRNDDLMNGSTGYTQLNWGYIRSMVRVPISWLVPYGFSSSLSLSAKINIFSLWWTSEVKWIKTISTQQ